MNKLLWVSLCFILLISCSGDTTSFETTTDENEENLSPETIKDIPNILLIIADDMGLDATPGLSIGDIKPSMPNLEELMRNGLTFNNVWSYPTCTPTRAAMITGKFGFRTGVTAVGDVLSTSETSVQRFIDENTGDTYSNAVVGKWHLSNDTNHPSSLGIDYFSGFLGGAVPSYTDWNYFDGSTTTATTEYTTTKLTDVAIDWIADQTKPWFLWLSYNAPHTPFHLPPNNLHAQGVLPADQASIDANPLPYYMAMLEAMDTEMGRVFNAMSQEEKDNTIIIFIGDNGTPNQVAQGYGNRRNKDTVYQGGVNVPMVVCGKDVTRINEMEDALINITDLYATIAEIAGTGTAEIHDSKSFKEMFQNTGVTGREFAFTEIRRDSDTYDYAIRNTTHKYILFADGTEALYNLSTDPLESQNLLSTDQLPLSDGDSSEMNELLAELSRILP